MNLIMNSILFSSKNDEWGTPPEVFNFLNNLYNFTLDAAASNENYLCPQFFTKESNALNQDWNGRVFCNPPYSKGQQKLFLNKAINELKTNSLCEIVVFLLPARTDTISWHEYIFPKANEIIFIKGRLKFINQANPTKSHSCATFPSCVVIFKKKKSNSIFKSWELGKQPEVIW